MYHLENVNVQLSKFYFQPLSSSAPLLSDYNQGFICLLCFLVVAGSYYEMTQKIKIHPVSISPSLLERNCMLLTSRFTKRQKKCRCWKWIQKEKNKFTPNLLVLLFLERPSSDWSPAYSGWDLQNRSCDWLLMPCSLDAPSTYFPNRKEQEEREEGRSQDVTKTIKTHWDQLGLLLCLFSNLCPEGESSYFHWFCFLQRCLLYQSLRKIRLYKSLPPRTRLKRPELITSSCYNGRDI